MSGAGARRWASTQASLAQDAAVTIRAMRRQGVSLVHAVRPLLAARGYRMKDLAQIARCPDWQVYNALAGHMPPPLRLRAALRGILGVDPWQVAQEAEAEALAQEGEGR